MKAKPLVNTIITLYVDTDPALNLKDTNIISHVWLGDSDGDSNGGSPTTYITNVKKNGNVTWVGAALNIKAHPFNYVVITNIKLDSNEGSIDISPEPTKPTDGNVTYVNGRIANKVPPTSFSYRIFFTVYYVDNSNGKRKSKDLHIDPVIQVHP